MINSKIKLFILNTIVLLFSYSRSRIVRIEGVLPFPVEHGPALAPSGIRKISQNYL
jgi:hypothetical protein